MPSRFWFQRCCVLKPSHQELHRRLESIGSIEIYCILTISNAYCHFWNWIGFGKIKMLNCVVFSWQFLTIYLYLSLSFSHRVAVTKVAKALARHCRRCWRRNCSCLRLPPAMLPWCHMSHTCHTLPWIQALSMAKEQDLQLIYRVASKLATHGAHTAQLFMSRLSSDFRWILQELLSICFGNLPRCVAFAEDVDLPTSVKLVGALQRRKSVPHG